MCDEFRFRDSSEPAMRRPAMSSDDSLAPLALEIHDAMMVLAPRGWHRVGLKLERTRDGLPRVIALETSLAPTVGGSSDPSSSAPKPDLGLDVAGFFGGLNEALGDVAHAMRARDVAWSGDAVAVVRTGRDDTRLEICDADGRAVFTVALDAGVRASTLFTDELFECLDARLPEAQTRQDRLGDEISGHDEWTYDQSHEQLALTKGNLPWRTYRAQIVGTFSFESETWLWAWANESVSIDPDSAAARLRAWAEREPGLGVFLRPTFPCDEPFVARIVLTACDVLGARGMFAASYGAGSVWFAVEPGAPVG